MTIVHWNMKANFDTVIGFKVPENRDFTSAEYTFKLLFWLIKEYDKVPLCFYWK
jgi:hypothetical protein